jgi:hypothetical protein
MPVQAYYLKIIKIIIEYVSFKSRPAKILCWAQKSGSDNHCFKVSFIFLICLYVAKLYTLFEVKNLLSTGLLHSDILIIQTVLCCEVLFGAVFL